VVDVGGDAAVLGANRDDDEVRTVTASTTVAVASSNLLRVLAEDRPERAVSAALRARIRRPGSVLPCKVGREERGGRGL
jgi:hypothetical protein